MHMHTSSQSNKRKNAKFVASGVITNSFAQKPYETPYGQEINHSSS